MKQLIIDRLNKEEFLALAKESNSLTDLCMKVGYNKSDTKALKKIKIRLNEYSFDFNSFKGKNLSILNNESNLKNIVAKNYTYSAVLKDFSLAVTGGNMGSLKKYINIFNIDIRGCSESILM